MAATIILASDDLLTTTRTVRKRLDLDRKVPRALIAECLDLALQAPNGSNRNSWEWVVVDDPALIAKAAALYRESMEDYKRDPYREESAQPEVRAAAMQDSAEYLARALDRMP